jgi:hypothetical protein
MVTVWQRGHQSDVARQADELRDASEILWGTDDEVLSI